MILLSITLLNQLDYFIQKSRLINLRKKRLYFCRRFWTRLSSRCPFPQPISIVELDSIETLITHGTLVIAAGGGGIPVIKENEVYTGVDAVIDKDKTSALLAAHLQSDQLIILTAVDHVYINYGKETKEVSMKCLWMK